MMCRWSWKLISALVSEVKKVRKLCALQTMPSASSDSCTGYSWFMEDWAIGDWAGSCAITSIKTSYSCSLRYSLRSRMATVVRYSLQIGYPWCTMQSGQVGSVSLHTVLNRMSMINTYTDSRNCTKLDKKVSTSALQYFGGGSCLLYGTE